MFGHSPVISSLGQQQFGPIPAWLPMAGQEARAEGVRLWAGIQGTPGATTTSASRLCFGKPGQEGSVVESVGRRGRHRMGFQCLTPSQACAVGWDRNSPGQNNGSPRTRNYFPLNWAQPRSVPTRPGISCASKGLVGKLLLWVLLFSKTCSSLSLGIWGLPCLASSPSPFPPPFPSHPIAFPFPSPSQPHPIPSAKAPALPSACILAVGLL